MIIVYVVARMLQLAGKLRQKWYARAGTNFTKPRTRYKREPITLHSK